MQLHYSTIRNILSIILTGALFAIVAVCIEYSYLWKPSEQYNPRAFNIIDMQINDRYVGLTVDNPDLVSEIRWRTHKSAMIETETVHLGSRIKISDVHQYSLFVRAEIEGAVGTIYTQPFLRHSK